MVGGGTALCLVGGGGSCAGGGSGGGVFARSVGDGARPDSGQTETAAGPGDSGLQLRRHVKNSVRMTQLQQHEES